MKIIGSGLSACLAGVLIPSAEIIEANSETKIHKALLRFRTPEIGKITGIPFKKVTVHKGIWHRGQNVALSPKFIVRYARKVSEVISARSIVNLEPVERYIAPDDFHEQLLAYLGNRIVYNSDLEVLTKRNEIKISTIPIYVTIAHLDELKRTAKERMSVNRDNFDFSGAINKIYVTKLLIPNCDMYATNYYTCPDTSVYRASLNGSELIIESNMEIWSQDIQIVVQSFGLDGINLINILDNYVQNNGKMSNLDDDKRKELLYRLTKDYNIYSLGRFAIWKNVVMDDVLNDVMVIKNMMHKSKYDQIIKGGK